MTNTATVADTFVPTGKTFKERLNAWLSDVQKVHALTVRQDSGRTAEWQQRNHICHMFLYNAYSTTTPASVEPGERTISWSHLADPKVMWATIPFTEILRTKTGGIPARAGSAWTKGAEPDQAATEKHAKVLLAGAGIGDGGKAMVSSGLKPCGEPCKCGAGRSKHLEGLAADLNTADLAGLMLNLTTRKAGTVDDYLKKFGLCRPLVNHPTSPEQWHVEATTP